MKVITKLGLVLLAMMISSSVLWAQSSVADIGSTKQLPTFASENQFEIQLKSPKTLYVPENVVAVYEDPDVSVTWNAPIPGEWIQWDNGENDGGKGMTNGGSFWVASHWLPDELTDPDAEFEIMVWTGPDAGTLVSTEVVTSFTVDAWNEITLSTPVTIDATEELWFGYKVTHGAGTSPAGKDTGPALPEQGDMISTNGTTWVSSHNQFNWDFNWNLAAFVMESGKKYTAKPLVKQLPAAAESAPSFTSSKGKGNNNCLH